MPTVGVHVRQFVSGWNPKNPTYHLRRRLRFGHQLNRDRGGSPSAGGFEGRHSLFATDRGRDLSADGLKFKIDGEAKYYDEPQVVRLNLPPIVEFNRDLGGGQPGWKTCRHFLRHILNIQVTARTEPDGALDGSRNSSANTDAMLNFNRDSAGKIPDLLAIRPS